MNLLRPQRILVATGDPRTSWIVLAHKDPGKPARARSLRVRPKTILTLTAVSLAGFLALPSALALLWNFSTNASLPANAKVSRIPSQNAVPATVGGAILPATSKTNPQTIPSQPAAATEPLQTTATPAHDRNSQDRIVIPKIGVNMPLVRGTTEQSLLLGAWLSPWGSTPDHGGNTTIFGHRFLHLYPNPETFYALDRLTAGDTFDVRWADKTYHYKVAETSVVSPQKVSVMDPTATPSVTLITCTPLFTTKQRLVVRGELLGTSP